MVSMMGIMKFCQLLPLPRPITDYCFTSYFIYLVRSIEFTKKPKLLFAFGIVFFSSWNHYSNSMLFYQQTLSLDLSLHIRWPRLALLNVICLKLLIRIPYLR